MTSSFSIFAPKCRKSYFGPMVPPTYHWLSSGQNFQWEQLMNFVWVGEGRIFLSETMWISTLYIEISSTARVLILFHAVSRRRRIVEPQFILFRNIQSFFFQKQVAVTSSSIYILPGNSFCRGGKSIRHIAYICTIQDGGGGHFDLIWCHAYTEVRSPFGKPKWKRLWVGFRR